MSLWERAGLAALRSTSPETAHGLALKALNAGLVPLPGTVTTPRLETELAGLSLPNPLGLAAGFDKNGSAIGPLSRAGFGFLELGATTPKPQPGNPKPRLFRLTEDAAAINRFGFNNTGMKAMAKRLAARSRNAVVGLNLGANKDSTDRAMDFAQVLAACGAYLDFATVNVSSPNTERLRDLQGKAALEALLAGVFKARDALPAPIPVFLKIAPDLDAAALKDIASLAQEMPLAGIITTNTTLDRDGLQSPHKGEKGGLSGAPLFEKSTRITAQLYALTEGQVPLIGVGGIASAEDAWTKIRSGASALQLYTALSYQGLSLVPRILNGLDETLQGQGYTNVAQAVGTDHENWL